MTFPDSRERNTFFKPQENLNGFSSIEGPAWFRVIITCLISLTLLLSCAPSIQAQNDITFDTNVKAVIASEIGYPPFSYINEKKELVGFNLELAREICKLTKVDEHIIVEPWANIRKKTGRQKDRCDCGDVLFTGA